MTPKTNVLSEAERLHKMGFSVLWLQERSKRPVEMAWTTGPKKTWEELKATYRRGYNVGTRLGTPSKIGKGFLCVIDVDVKSTDSKHAAEASNSLMKLIGDKKLPKVSSGRGNGSAHHYCLTVSPFKTWNPAESKDLVKVYMPSKSISARDREKISAKELDAGFRMSKAWEISLYSDGRQVVLPPSIHPDSGKLYNWVHYLKDVQALPVMEFSSTQNKEKSGGALGVLEDYAEKPVELEWLSGISDKVKAAIIKGEGVVDRSGYLMLASSALHAAGLTRDEILSVLSNKNYALGEVAYEHAQTGSRKKAVEWLWKYTVSKVLEEKSAKAAFDAVAVVEDIELSEEEAAKQSEEIAAERHWSAELKRNQSNNGKGSPKPLVENVVMILENTAGAKVFKRDSFAFRDTYGCDAPWGGKEGELLTDEDAIDIKIWLGRTWNFEPSNDKIYESMAYIAKKNSFDPVRDFLEGLPLWDRVPRLDEWLLKNFEAEGDPDYLAQVFRKWMVAMVMRVYEPGAKFDWMPIFEGAQGVGKSSLGRLICGEKHFLDWLPALGDKDAAQGLQGIWGVEMGELATLRKNEIEIVKSYLTRTVDKFRPSYGKKWIESPRRCVFFGTTNHETYLRDETGNRRFKPVKVGRLNFDNLEADREQLFAEAKYLYDSFQEGGRSLEIGGKAKIFEASIQREKMVVNDVDVMIEFLQEFIDQEMKKDPEERTLNLSNFRLTELFEIGGPLHQWRPEGKNYQFAGVALSRVGAEKVKRNTGNFWKMDENYGF